MACLAQLSKIVTKNWAGSIYERSETTPNVLEKIVMKSYCKGLIVDRPLVFKAYEQWLKADSGKKNNWRVFKEYGSVDNLVNEIVYEVATWSLKLRPIRHYCETERGNGKVRLIGQQSVKQQILDYVLVTALTPMLDAKIGFYQIASVPNKGPIFGAKNVQKWISDSKYWVHADIRKCYESIPHYVVMRIFHKYVKNTDLLYICRKILSSYDKGLDIGSFFSLKMAQLVLSFGYHYLESLHKNRRGANKPLINHQIWYADDLYVFSNDKRDLKMAMRKLSAYFKNEFEIEFKDWKVCMTNDDEPVDIAGYVCRENRVTLRSNLYLRIRRAYANYEKNPTIKKARTVCSYWGYLKHSDSYDAIKKNNYDATFRKARRQISQYDREVNANASN